VPEGVTQVDVEPRNFVMASRTAPSLPRAAPTARCRTASRALHRAPFCWPVILHDSKAANDYLVAQAGNFFEDCAFMHDRPEIESIHFGASQSCV
jgi:hypothetical protein